MDVTAFSNDDFVVKDWINTMFECTEAQQDKEAFVSSLVMKLQLYVQQVNGSLEETNQLILSSLPRIFRDIQLLQQEAVALKDKMKIVKEEIAKVEKDTVLSINALEKIDKIKTDLEHAKQSLHEADNWTVLANDVEEVFESGDIESIAQKLLSMQKSLSMLVTASDYEDKKLQLEGLKNRLEAITSPKLVQAFTSRNLENSKFYVVIFNKIDRLDQLLKYYHNCLKVILTDEWRKLSEFDQEDGGITNLLHKYYDKLLLEFQNQTKWCNQLFPSSSITIIINIYTDLFQNLNSNLENCISSSLKQHSVAIQLSLLLELKQITRNFAMNLQNSIQVFDYKASDDKLKLLAQAIYYPYVNYVAKYDIYELAHLNDQLKNLHLSNDDLSEYINSLSLSISKTLDFATQSIKRCETFTEGCGFYQSIQALEKFLNNYLDNYIDCINIIKRRYNSNKQGKYEDWNLFQQCLTLMQTIGDFYKQFEDFQRILMSNITETYEKITKNDNSPFKDYKSLLLTKDNMKNYDQLIVKVKNRKIENFENVTEKIRKLCIDLHSVTYDVVFLPIYQQLITIKNVPTWSTSAQSTLTTSHLWDLPDYSFSPQEYITQVGQYLMTLPQHLEPFLLRDNPSLIYALKAADAQYNSASESGFTGVLLGIIAKGTCQMFQDQIFGICQLNLVSCKQLAIDINYLGNIFDELGLVLSDNLQQMSKLLRLSPEEYQSGCSGCNPRIVAAVRQMRNIQSSG
ncbi:conserved oligomeric Golgi complex subunit 7 [Chelonus insularis]|uniref:conserved oligomeric Golgi complex subunit 7 n=1 Tax=Chelonus insularis TaxID=460826 RepID=UPI00158F2EB3|nr:conserved oligomeric Golgi complex subunit 7 [Chelonus insularis]